MGALRVSFYIGAVMAFLGAIVSALRGERTIAEEETKVSSTVKKV